MSDDVVIVGKGAFSSVVVVIIVVVQRLPYKILLRLAELGFLDGFTYQTM
jgi:hypothetical protein